MAGHPLLANVDQARSAANDAYALCGTYPPTTGTLDVSSSAVIIGTSGLTPDLEITGVNFGVTLKTETDDVWLLFATTGDATAGTASEIKLAVTDGWLYFPATNVTRISTIRETNDAVLHMIEHTGAVQS